MSDDKPVNRPVEFEGADPCLHERFAGMPFESPVQPNQLALDSEFQFDCHPGIACFNACCRNIDIQILPYDILRLKQRLGEDSREFVARRTTPFEMDPHGTPGLKLNTRPGSRECQFLGEQGCSVYEDRPTACRYYALGNMSLRRKDSHVLEDLYFIVKEPHCKGHEEPRTLTVRDYRREQGVEHYDDMNREWRDIIVKKRSSGPTVGTPSARSLQLFDMCSYDMDSFREFIRTSGFVDVFDLSHDDYRALLDDEEELLAFSMRFLKQVLFGEMTIPRKQGARERRLHQRRDVLEQRGERQAEERRQTHAQYGQDKDAD